MKQGLPFWELTYGHWVYVKAFIVNVNKCLKSFFLEQHISVVNTVAHQSFCFICTSCDSSVTSSCVWDVKAATNFDNAFRCKFGVASITLLFVCLYWKSLNGYFDKQWRPGWKAAWCCISSGYSLFAKIKTIFRYKNTSNILFLALRMIQQVFLTIRYKKNHLLSPNCWIKSRPCVALKP